MRPGRERGPGAGTPDLDQKVVLDGDDENDGNSVAQIIASIRETLPTPTAADRAWNEQARNRVELAAWLNGRRRICDLVGSDQ